jgi:hypothetical protein
MPLEQVIQAPCHFDEMRVSQALDWSFVDFTRLSRPGLIAYGYPQS